MDRRRFINGIGLAGMLAFLQSCRLTNLFDRSPAARVSTSIPTRTPHPLPTFTPTASSTPMSTQTPASTTTPTDIPPTETAAASPTVSIEATVIPTPTPYPPGPPSKLGLFVTGYNPFVLEIAAIGKPALIKTMEIDGGFTKGLKDVSPSSLIVGRIFLEQLNLDIDPLPLARQFVDKLLPLATDPLRMESIDAWEAYNEPVADTIDKMKRLADFEAERTRLLAEQGVRSVVGNFAAGHPPLELWPQFKPALHAVKQYNGYLGLHEYSAPVMQYRAGDLQPAGDPPQGDEGWLTLRYRKAYRQYLQPMGYGDIPALITECGVDGLIRPRPGPDDGEGWQDFVDFWLANGLRNDPPGLYMDQLIWYDENLQQDDYVKGSAIFLAGANDPQWNSYDLLGSNAGRLPELLMQYLQAHPPG
jgi:hypothetical protein